MIYLYKLLKNTQVLKNIIINGEDDDGQNQEEKKKEFAKGVLMKYLNF